VPHGRLDPSLLRRESQHVKDPDELENAASKVDAAVLAKLHARTEALVKCHSAACRAAEEKP
jgi:hypothetical protein